MLRDRAKTVMEKIEKAGCTPFVYGSVARGDVSATSDVDIIVLTPVSSFRLELPFQSVIRRELVQATPSMVLKGHIYLEGDTVVTFPLFRLRPREEEFYRWGGLLNTSELDAQKRVPGVDKRLILIEPTNQGHIESGVIGHEEVVARKLGVSPGIAEERVRVLTRRDEVGRTGVYLTRVLHDDESFEEVARDLRDRDPALRRTYERRQGR
ncbi:nucleotidyltransferase [Candidatus Thorarchaeota archaeon]|nr:MAG: nucleotidyltransferase [Candidatus Thorarchaeota archaeon]